MKHQRIKYTAAIWFGLGLTTLLAQESINTAGGNATGNGGSASYSVGQVSYTTNTGSTGSVAQGVQHAFEIYPLGTEEVQDILLTAYPNPTKDFLKLEINILAYDNLKYQLFDIQGRILQKRKITDNFTQIAMGELPVGTYLIKITQENKEVKTFKIIKN